MNIQQILNRLGYIIDKLENKQYDNYLDLSNSLTSLYNDISNVIYQQCYKKNKQMKARKEREKNESKN